MKKRRHTTEQIIRKLREAEAALAAGKTVAEVCQVLEVSDATYHRWQRQYGGDAAGRGEADARARGGESAAEEARRGPEPRQADPRGGAQGKTLSPSRRREAVRHVRPALGVSERRACRALGQPRGTHRYVARVGEFVRRAAVRARPGVPALRVPATPATCRRSAVAG